MTGVDILSHQATTGPYVNAGSGAWAATSDRAVKENFRPVDARQILASAIDLPITSWNYIAEGKKIRHLGPVSQDFWAAFGLGADDKSITSIDETGMALVAIQGLNAKLEERLAEKERQISAHEHEIEELRSELAGLRDMVAGAIRRSTGAAGLTAFERSVCLLRGRNRSLRRGC